MFWAEQNGHDRQVGVGRFIKFTVRFTLRICVTVFGSVWSTLVVRKVNDALYSRVEAESKETLPLLALSVATGTVLLPLRNFHSVTIAVSASEILHVPLHDSQR